MSLSYRAATQIQHAAREHGWEIRPAEMQGAGWTIHKGRYKVAVGERKDGGLCWLYLHYPVSGGMNVDYFGPRFVNKLDAVLDFLAAPHRYRRTDVPAGSR